MKYEGVSIDGVGIIKGDYISQDKKHHVIWVGTGDEHCIDWYQIIPETLIVNEK